MIIARFRNMFTKATHHAKNRGERHGHGDSKCDPSDITLVYLFRPIDQRDLKVLWVLWVRDIKGSRGREEDPTPQFLKYSEGKKDPKTKVD